MQKQNAIAFSFFCSSNHERELAPAVIKRTKKGLSRAQTFLHFSAETEGFEPSIRLPVYTLSRRAPSTARPPLRIWFKVIDLDACDNRNLILMSHLAQKMRTMG